jgi:quinol monooxygenase YgiN
MNIFVLQIVLSSKKQQEEVFQILRLLAGPTQVQPGCLACQVYQEVPTQKKRRVLLLETWETQEALERHICSENFRKVLTVMDLASEPPEIEFYTVVSQTQGMEFIQALRGGNNSFF